MNEWLQNLSVGDRVRVGHPRMREQDFVYTRIRFSEASRVGIETGCGRKRWFSRRTGAELDVPEQWRGVLKP